MGRIGQSLAAGNGYGNPFVDPSGPTAWEPPLYPFLIAGIFKLFGIYTHASAIVLLLLNSIFSALTCIPIFLVARRCFDVRIAVATAWLWALLPNMAFWATRWVWETSFSTLLLATIFWVTLIMGEREGWKPWMGFGLLWGVAALTNTSLLAFLPASGLWIWYRRSKLGKRSLAGVLVACLFFTACIAPWLARNYQTFGKFIFIRSNFGVELWIGNSPGADGTWREYLHPTKNAYEMRRFLQAGELAYASNRKHDALQFIRADWPRFFWLDVKRFIFYWGGVPQSTENPEQGIAKNSLFLASSVLAFWGLGRALRKKRPGAWLFLWLILLYPAVYYCVFPHPRYRHPMEPELGILIVYVICEATEKKPGAGEDVEIAS
jgi:4-amino-4-deoxy-L-arabinose transferase-like glycosyltransferase